MPSACLDWQASFIHRRVVVDGACAAARLRQRAVEDLELADRLAELAVRAKKQR
jgi:hypothetical protein